MHVFDTSDSDKQKGKENKTGEAEAAEDVEDALEYLPFDLIDDDVVV